MATRSFPPEPPDPSPPLPPSLVVAGLVATVVTAVRLLEVGVVTLNDVVVTIFSNTEGGGS